MSIRQNLKRDLAKNGYSDVQVMPTSFFVRAKDKNGQRVMMMIGPDSVTMITKAGAKMSKNSGSDASSSNNGSTSQ